MTQPLVRMPVAFPVAFVARQITGSEQCRTERHRFHARRGRFRSENMRKNGDIKQNAARKIESAGRIAVLVLSIRGEQRADTEIVMKTIK
jgi:hypothetical protein